MITGLADNGFITLQQRYYRTATLLLKCNCYILWVRGSLKVVLSFNYCFIIFMPKPSCSGNVALP